jgi:hypothetical protein|tara:strand:+ start:729 stop:1088 length:360 start_codon:yes stop_codon:yes gene_type:complete
MTKQFYSRRWIPSWDTNAPIETSKNVDAFKYTKRGPWGFIVRPNKYLDNTAIWSVEKTETAKLYHLKQNKGKFIKWGCCHGSIGRKHCRLCCRGKVGKSLKTMRKIKYKMNHKYNIQMV